MKILILGHNGFIVRYIVESFQTQSPDSTLIGLSYPEIDLTSQESISDITKHLTQDTVVIMCAAIKKQLGDNLEIFKKNLRIIENLCEIIQANPVRQLIYFSSAAVYGEDIHNTCIDEKTQIQPRTFYGIGKFAAERLLWKTMSNAEDSVLAILRPPLIYGYGDDSKGYGPAGFCDKLTRNREIMLWGDGSELREFLYVKDIADIVYQLVLSRFGGVLNPVNGKSNSFQDVLDILHKITGLTANLDCRARSKAKVDNVFLSTYFRKIIPQFQFTPLENGLIEMFEKEKKNH